MMPLHHLRFHFEQILNMNIIIYVPGVSFVQVASLKADGVGSTNNLLDPGCVCGVVVFVLLLADDEPNGPQRLRLFGRWLMESQSNDRFNVAHAISLKFETIMAYDFNLCIREN